MEEKEQTRDAAAQDPQVELVRPPGRRHLTRFL
jgi:hypothetical protein